MTENYLSLNGREYSVVNSPQCRSYETGRKKQKSWFKNALMAAALLVTGSSALAQTNIAAYAFSKSTGAVYTPITGGTKLFPSGTNTTYDNDVSSAIILSSPFTFGGVAVTSVYVSANGFITFGAAPSGTNYTPLSSLGSTTGAISAFGQDGGFSSSDLVQPSGNHEVRYEDLGTEFVVQWQDHANYNNRATERLNFQIHLVYATGEIKIVYGNCTDPGTVSTTNTTPQVGIRGNSTTFATNVSPLMIGNIPAGTTCDWSKAVTGNSNSSAMLFSGTTNVNVKIPTGLQYVWTPSTLLPVRTFAATTGVTNAGATISWTAPTGATAYNVQYRALGSCDWTNYSGNPVSATTATITGLSQNTTYQVQVQALNGTTQAMYSHIPNLSGSGSGFVTAGSFTTLANCASTVTGLASSGLTPDKATISWTASTTPPGNGYEYYYSTSSTAPSNTTTPSGTTAAGIVTANLTGLTPSTTYYYWVRGNCNGTDKGVWSSSANFVTLSTCPTISAPAVNAIGISTTPTITWTAINGATGYRLTVGTTSGGTDVVNNVDVGNTTSYTFSSALNTGTKYYYTVSGYTATTTGTACTTVGNFTTLCNPVTSLPWTENFDTMTSIGSAIVPVCWSQVTGTKSWTSMSTASTTYNAPKSAPNYMSIAYSNTNASQLWTPAFELTAGTAYELSFYYNTNGTSSSYIGFTGDVKVNTSTSLTGATTLGTFITATQGTTAYTPYKVVFTPSATGNYNFAINVSSTGAPWYLGVDDFKLQLAPSCVEPTALTASAITSNSANVSWTAPSAAPASGYQIYYSTSSTAPTSTTTPSMTGLTGTSVALNALSPATMYYVWVRSNCGSSQSDWSQAGMFTTACVAMTTLNENFDSATVGSLPPCWTSIGTTASYGTINASSAISSPNVLYIYTSGTSTGMVATPEISNLQSGNYTLKFKGRANFTAGGIVQIGYLTNPSDTSTFVTLGSYTSTSTTTVDNYSLDITGVPAGVNKLVFKHTGTPSNSVLIDDVSYALNPSLSTTETSVAKNTVKVYPNPFSDILNISDIKNVKNVLVTDIAGRLVKTIANPSSALQLGELKQGMYLVTLEMKDGSRQTFKVIKK
jgi:hypothetical protein